MTREGVEARVTIGPGCWEWTGAHTTKSKSLGYAVVRIFGKVEYVHRLMYQWARGPIPRGLEIDHLCRNRGCVRPDHMEAVDHRTNARRGWTGKYQSDPGKRVSGG